MRRLWLGLGLLCLGACHGPPDRALETWYDGQPPSWRRGPPYDPTTAPRLPDSPFARRA